jgi:deoxyribonuclease-1
MNKRIFIPLTGLLGCLALSAYAQSIEGNTTIESFNKAKNILERKVYHNHRETFYCDSEFRVDKTISNRNGYIPQKESKRANRMEWEHVVPAPVFGRSFEEWRKGHPECINSKGKPYYGRSCARKTAALFRYMESDMYNLVPVIGEIKQLRSYYSYAIIPGEEREFGECDIEIEGRKVEPRPDLRGDIARTYFYMDAAYPDRGIISQKNREMFELWTSEDPVSYWECRRTKRIERQQRNENPFVKWPCKEKHRW